MESGMLIGVLKCKRLRLFVVFCTLWALLGMMLLIMITALQHEVPRMPNGNFHFDQTQNPVILTTQKPNKFFLKRNRSDNKAKVVNCSQNNLDFRYEYRGKHVVLRNYLHANKKFDCVESVTYTTHGETDFLSNLVPLCELWKGPISIAVYSPGSDFQVNVNSILYLRKCFQPCIQELVSFHLFFDTEHFPANIPTQSQLYGQETNINCSSHHPPWIRIDKVYRLHHDLYYPINVARNIARLAATTHYLLPSDVELYPSANLIKDFLDMVHRDNMLLDETRKVFVLPIFEVRRQTRFPTNKVELLKMLYDGTAITFHKAICDYCHRIPRMAYWKVAEISDGLHVFHVAKRQGSFHDRWEPIYIGTNQEPFYDERLTWEGIEDKMSQGYVMCVLDYEFHILDNGFLVHRPGIKSSKRTSRRWSAARAQRHLITTVISKEIKVMYGERENCYL